MNFKMEQVVALPLPAGLHEAFLTLLGPSGLRDPAAYPQYFQEPRGRHGGTASLILRPQDTAQVAGVLRLCHAARVPVVPYGGGTGLVGGQLRPDPGPTVVLSLERMNRIRDINPLNMALTAEAGCVLADVQAAADQAGLLFPLALASQGSCQLGGNLATNAGGLNVLRYGNARDLCLGIEAVLADGTVVNDLKALRKDNTGYDLRHLLIGSEGTLGVITAATLKLFARPQQTVTAMLTMPNPDHAVRALRQMQGVLAESISAFELMSATGMAMLAQHFPALVPPVAPGPWYVLIETGGGEGHAEQAMLALMAVWEQGLASDCVIAQSEQQRAQMWAIRETMPEANRRVGAVSSHDLSVPIDRIADYIAAATLAVARVDPSLRINCFGHLGDGNLHFNLFPPDGKAARDFEALRPQLKQAIHDLVHDYAGSVSAEHGLGRLKTGDLLRYGDPGKLAAMRAIKAALDPRGILNPGVIFQPEGRT